MWWFCDRRLSWSYLSLNVQIRSSTRWPTWKTNYGKPQKTCVSLQTLTHNSAMVICIYKFIIMSHNNFPFLFLHRGQSPAEADLNLLETARRCELYGTKMHPAKVNDPFWYFLSDGLLKWLISHFKFLIRIFLVLGPRRSSIEFSCRSHGGTGLPKLYQNKHVLLGKDTKTKFQKEEIPYQITSWRICKFLITAF